MSIDGTGSDSVSVRQLWREARGEIWEEEVADQSFIGDAALFLPAIVKHLCALMELEDGAWIG